MATDFVKETAIKKYISEKKLRSSTAAVDFISNKTNELITAIVDQAAKNAVDDERKTVMPDDMTSAFDQVIAKEDLEWNEILNQILAETPANLGNINKGIDDFLETIADER